ncbi:FAD-linked oxidoreductase sor8 [Colletotrichum spinosum]|uniref:FAD-linked oxidoreductase sor8 n=1 Tax=Colletotrichum spinosum TaxID=1347390 RepID=A0A4R8QPN3_9PEZI|nr:FAD-linked oxidoreductase sor8 [Colletotrichum spinosum]
MDGNAVEAATEECFRVISASYDSWEVVTSDGTLVIATPQHNADLYWALSGGGGGACEVVVSMTTRLSKDEPIGRASFNFSVATTAGDEQFWTVVDVFHCHLQLLVDNRGIDINYVLTNNGLTVKAMTAANRTSSEVADLLSPLTKDLERFNLSKKTIGVTSAQAATYREHGTYYRQQIIEYDPVRTHHIPRQYRQKQDRRWDNVKKNLQQRPLYVPLRRS